MKDHDDHLAGLIIITPFLSKHQIFLV